jgi:hypothetical protein
MAYTAKVLYEKSQKNGKPTIASTSSTVGRGFIAYIYYRSTLGEKKHIEKPTIASTSPTVGWGQKE